MGPEDALWPRVGALRATGTEVTGNRLRSLEQGSCYRVREKEGIEEEGCEGNGISEGWLILEYVTWKEGWWSERIQGGIGRAIKKSRIIEWK